MPDMTNFCQVCEETARRLDVVKEQLDKFHKDWATVEKHLAQVTYQRNMLYYFISNCVEQWDMTKEIRDLVAELKRNEI